MNFKRAYTRFKQWQLDPFEYDVNSRESHKCHNCGSDFEGNFCPVCSQKNNLGPITWKSVAHSVAEVWGLHNRSLLFSVVQIFLRPGYFIGDYISGKRQVSFPPVKMLAIIALLGILVDILTGSSYVGLFNSDFDFEGDKMLFLDNAFEWMNTHPDLMSMIMLSYLIIPNYYIFRFAPRNTYHTLPQGFFIQVFSSVAFLLLNMVYDVTSMGGVVFVLGVLWLYFAYKQLFGYGIWGTVWRLVATVTAGILLASIMLWLDFCIHLFNAGQSGTATGFILFELVSIIVFIAVLWICYRISKPRTPKSEPEPDSFEPDSFEPDSFEPESIEPDSIETEQIETDETLPSNTEDDSLE
jgi:hypothetical protein